MSSELKKVSNEAFKYSCKILDQKYFQIQTFESIQPCTESHRAYISCIIYCYVNSQTLCIKILKNKFCIHFI